VEVVESKIADGMDRQAVLLARYHENCAHIRHLDTLLERTTTLAAQTSGVMLGLAGYRAVSGARLIETSVGKVIPAFFILLGAWGVVSSILIEHRTRTHRARVDAKTLNERIDALLGELDKVMAGMWPVRIGSAVRAVRRGALPRDTSRAPRPPTPSTGGRSMNTATCRVIRFLVVLGAGALGATAGCAARKPPPPFVPPGAAVELSHFSGSALSGPTTKPVSDAAAADQAWAVDVSFVALERMPRAALEPLGARARLIVATRGGQPVLPSAKLTADARCAIGSEADAFGAAIERGTFGRRAQIGAARGAVPPGVTLTARAAAADDVAGDGAGAGVREVVVSRAAGAHDELQLALVVEDLVAPEVAEQDEEEPAAEHDAKRSRRKREAPRAASAAATRTVLQRELALVDRTPLSADGVTAAFLVPVRFAGSGAEGVAAIVRVQPIASSPDRDALYESAMRQVARSIANEAARPPVVSVGADEAQSYPAVLDTLASSERRRRSLVYLADRTGAAVCLDLALVADDATLADLAARAREATSDLAVTDDRDKLGWSLDRAALALLAARGGADRAPPELKAALVSHAGEAGRQGGLLEEILANAATRDDFDARLVAENYIFLEDSSPASRVRAYDWLLARGRAPQGYDPLASNRERRDALERALAAPASPAAAGIAAHGGQP
jgi:hypothetical protein